MTHVAMETSSDADLVRDAIDGESEAFEALAGRHWAWISEQLQANGWSRCVAEDATQEAFEALLVSVDKVRDPDRVRWWLLTVARRRALRCRTRDVPSDNDLLILDAVDEDPQNDGLATVLKADESRRIRKALARLGPRDQEALTLRYVENLSGEDIAATLGLGHTTARSVLRRAHRRLAEACRTTPMLVPLVKLRHWIERRLPEPLIAAAAPVLLPVLALQAMLLLGTPGDSDTTTDARVRDSYASAATEWKPTNSATLVTDVLGDSAEGRLARARALPNGRPVLQVGETDVITIQPEAPPGAWLELPVPGDDRPISVYGPPTLPVIGKQEPPCPDLPVCAE